jgi:hypothetical protein
VEALNILSIVAVMSASVFEPRHWSRLVSPVEVCIKSPVSSITNMHNVYNVHVYTYEPAIVPRSRQEKVMETCSPPEAWRSRSSINKLALVRIGKAIGRRR